ncbi:hypothetical protein NEAUS06_1226 [Nematocida ausubeli]|nr:hypothetical protein NEAUS06_1226 [Nematocida ausubeli]
MGQDLRQLENALKKIRIDFPEVMQEKYIPGPAMQRISDSEKMQDEFESTYEMLSAGLEALIAENTKPLKNSAITYHKVHKEIVAASHNITEVEACLTELIKSVQSDSIGKHIEDLKQEQEKYIRDLKESEIKKALAVDMLTIGDIHAGRLSEIMNNIQCVEDREARMEVKCRTENGLWKVKKEIEGRIKDSLQGVIRISPVDIRVLEKIAGCALVPVYKSTNECMVRIINRATREMHKEMHKKEVVTGEDEAQILSRELAVFASEVSNLLHNIQTILHKRKEECTSSKKYRYNPELYEEIWLNREASNKTAQVSLPLYDSSVLEEDIFKKIVEWISVFFKRLTKDTEGAAEDTIAYGIQKINRLDSASLMYNELFYSKYGHLTKDENSVETDLFIMNVHLVRSEDAILIIHGCALEISATMRDVLADVLPAHVDISDKIKDVELISCFANRKQMLMDLVERVEELEKTADHTMPFLQKYQRAIKRVLGALGRFAKVRIAGLEIKIEEAAADALGRVLASMQAVFKAISRVSEEELEEIKYHAEDSISGEIERWNNPEEKESALGPSIFMHCTSRKFIAISEFIQLPNDILSLITHMSMSTIEKSTKEKKTEEHTQGPMEQIQAGFTKLAQMMFGCFTVHLLSLVGTTIDQLLTKADVLDRKLEHFLLIDTYLVQKTRSIILEYITTYFLVHIERFSVFSHTFTFKQAVISLQQCLESKADTSVFSNGNYLPVHVFYILPYVEKKDQLFGTGLLEMYSQNQLLCKRIKEIFKIPSN